MDVLIDQATGHEAALEAEALDLMEFCDTRRPEYDALIGSDVDAGD